MDIADGMIMTIEGNARSKVGERIYELDDSRIVGFCKPLYALAEVGD